MLETLSLLPSDPLLGLITRYKQDSNPDKIDLGVGVYKDSKGQTPVLDCVKQAENKIWKDEVSKTYVGPMGNMNFNNLMARLVFGAESEALASGRISLLQATGGCGALRVGAEIAIRANNKARIWVSDPTWANHIPLLGGAGLEIVTYPYYNHDTKALDFDAMVAKLKSDAVAGDLVLLHGCCHNPSGADLTHSQWSTLAEIMLEQKLVPFVDVAYLGFGDNIQDDLFGVRLIAEKFSEALFAVSCSKSFGLYRERVGAVGVLSPSPEKTRIVESHVVNIARGMYSMPPSHGAQIVEYVLGSEELSMMWKQELELMRKRIVDMRAGVVQGLQTTGFKHRFDFIQGEKGMFSFMGIEPESVKRLADEYAIYMADSSRICIAGLTDANIPYFCNAVAKVLSK